ncbi:cystathionine gamma-lyase [Nitratireductor sp. GISD-1A_MAKvit]|uniref:cystathionine gamma-lyase n=1 Tax=Nitratireductor sp. GISD-1A_MAKvit TaxID=3234198 RepID=UPI003467025B
MTDSQNARAASLSHLHSAKLSRGDPLSTPIVMSSVFHLPGDPAGARQYGRFDSPTWEAVEAALAHLEEAEALVFPSGMAAISSVLLALLSSGDRVLIPSDGYYTPRVLLEKHLTRLGIGYDTRPTATFLDGGFSGYGMVLVETPSNPGLDVCDIEAVAKAARSEGAITVADNTTMTPYGQRPLDLGIDIVLASDTKAPNGHSDVLFGHVASRNAKMIETIREWRKLAGVIPGPFEAWLVLRGLETLEVRFDRMCSSAEIIASRLADHPMVQSVRYPGLKDDPSHALAKTQMLRSGSLIGLTLASKEKAERFIDTCPLIEATTSFGSVHTSAERRARWGDDVAEGFVRLSVGCEPTETLWEAIDTALKTT